MTKKVESTGDVCIKFTEDELVKLNIKEGDKFSFKETDDGIILTKFQKIDIDISEWNRDILEFLITESCEKDLSVNDIINNILEKQLEKINEQP